MTYDDVLYHAAELAGRTRDKLPLGEAAMLRAFLAVYYRQAWRRAWWPESVVDPEKVTVTNRRFTKREGTATEMGDIVGVYDRDPLATTLFTPLPFEERNGEVLVLDPAAEVYVEYQAPAPELLGLTAAALSATVIPRRFAAALALNAAGHLLQADLTTAAQGQSYLRMADDALAEEQNSVVTPEHWIRVRS
ncbi:hypothetical protein CCP3SC15_850011 [Gammaproteobacteria bacterium]